MVDLSPIIKDIKYELDLAFNFWSDIFNIGEPIFQKNYDGSLDFTVSVKEIMYERQYEFNCFYENQCVFVYMHDECEGEELSPEIAYLMLWEMECRG